MRVTEPSEIFGRICNDEWTIAAINYDPVKPGGIGGVTWISLSNGKRYVHLKIEALIEHEPVVLL